MVEAKEIYSSMEEKLEKCIEHTEEVLSSIRAGKASVNMLHGVLVESYGTQMPIDQVASVTVPDSKTVLIQPWDKTVIKSIEKAIVDANLGVTPSNNGETIRLNLPPLTEDRRRDLAKQTKSEGENAKVTIRNARRDAIEMFKKAKKDGMAEDMVADGEANIQKIVDSYTKKIDTMMAQKEKDIMTV